MGSRHLPGLTLPMLPKSLATDRYCRKARSARPTVYFVIDAASGEVLSSRRTRTVICSRRSFSYEEVERFLAGEKLSGLTDDVRVLLSTGRVVSGHAQTSGGSRGFADDLPR